MQVLLDEAPDVVAAAWGSALRVPDAAVPAKHTCRNWFAAEWIGIKTRGGPQRIGSRALLLDPQSRPLSQPCRTGTGCGNKDMATSLFRLARG